jgi:electron transfer flavoprotein alpha subunit
MYAGNAIATIEMTDPLKMLLIRPTAFEKAERIASGVASREAVSTTDAIGALGVEFVEAKVGDTSRPDLGTARVVVSGVLVPMCDGSALSALRCGFRWTRYEER